MVSEGVGNCSIHKPLCVPWHPSTQVAGIRHPALQKNPRNQCPLMSLGGQENQGLGGGSESTAHVRTIPKVELAPNMSVPRQAARAGVTGRQVLYRPLTRRIPDPAEIGALSSTQPRRRPFAACKDLPLCNGRNAKECDEAQGRNSLSPETQVPMDSICRFPQRLHNPATSGPLHPGGQLSLQSTHMGSESPV